MVARNYHLLVCMYGWMDFIWKESPTVFDPRLLHDDSYMLPQGFQDRPALSHSQNTNIHPENPMSSYTSFPAVQYFLRSQNDAKLGEAGCAVV